MNSMKNTLICSLLIAISSWSTNAFAQAEIVPEEKLETATKEDVSGWNPSLSGNATLNLVSNSNVVGQVEGLSILFGLGLVAGIDFVHGKHLWRNNLAISQSWARTPVVDEFVKNNDLLDLESMYNYFILEWFGVFARLNLKTSILKSQIVTADPVNYVITETDGVTQQPVVTADRLQIADPLKPLTLSESVGVFAEPVRTEPANVSLRLGAGGRQTFAEDVLIVNDDETTADQIELQKLANVSQLGVELFAGLEGKVKEGRLSYDLGVSVLIPFVNNDAFDRSGTELTRLAIEGNVAFSVFEWMSLVFRSEFVRDPQLFPEGEELNQFQNSLLLTFQYTFVDRKEGLQAMEEKAKAEREAKEREELEKKAADAEAKNIELEEKLKAAEEAAKKAEETKPEPQPEEPKTEEPKPEEPKPEEPKPEPEPN